MRVLIDHCGRPTPQDGIEQPGFKALLRSRAPDACSVKLSGYAKFARAPYPFEDAWPFVRALVDAFTLDRCLWASDWPYLRATERQDYGPLVALAATLFPDGRDAASCSATRRAVCLILAPRACTHGLRPARDSRQQSASR